ncbi:MAG: hypothetical protein ACK5HU_06320 [Flavobacteriales bacterium]
MRFTKRVFLIERIDQLIKLKATGTPSNLAIKLKISEASLFRIINEMKELEAPISYCINTQSYVYENPVSFQFGFYTRELSLEEQREINAGQGFKNILNFYKKVI